MNPDASPAILLLEDDPVLSAEVRSFLEKKGFVCDAVYDGSLVEKQLRTKTYDIALLDVNVPGLNGLEVCHRLRTQDTSLPILMLTAYGEIEDKTEAYEKGADDYLVKPFHLEELLLRIKALLRRKAHKQEPENRYEIADLTIDLDAQTAARDGQEIPLSPKEFRLLALLAKAGGRVLSKTQISDALWEPHIEPNPNTIEVYINFLRRKIDRDFTPKLIHTRVGFGYYLREE